jgi:hypothetical protein
MSWLDIPARICRELTTPMVCSDSRRSRKRTHLGHLRAHMGWRGPGPIATLRALVDPAGQFGGCPRPSHPTRYDISLRWIDRFPRMDRFVPDDCAASRDRFGDPEIPGVDAAKQLAAHLRRLQGLGLAESRQGTDGGERKR